MKLKKENSLPSSAEVRWELKRERKQLRFRRILTNTIHTLIVVAAVAAPIFAADGGEATTGSITIDGIKLVPKKDENGMPIEGQTELPAHYSIYKILDLEYKDNAHSYTIADGWAEFFTDNADPDVADALDYVTVTDGYVQWKKDVAADSNSVPVKEFAALALTYAKSKNIDAVKSTTNTSDYSMVTSVNEVATIVFENLPFGYYLVDSTLGALCGLTSTNPDGKINAKNQAPTLDKEVQEDSLVTSGQEGPTGNGWYSSNTASIGQTVYYQVTIKVHAGAQNYVFHDEMSEGLTFNKVELIQHIDLTNNQTDTVTDNYYDIISDPDDGCTFEIEFNDEFCNHLNNNDNVIIYYSAILNEKAVIADEGNPNEAWLDYGENNSTTHDVTVTKTFQVEVVKTDLDKNILLGAEFELYETETGTNAMKLVKEIVDEDVYYRPYIEGESTAAENITTSIVLETGKVIIKGLDNGNYYLKETKAPQGYNLLSSRIMFTVSDANISATYSTDGRYLNGGVQVVNQTGTMLPETGALGTTLFILIGGMVVLGSGVVLFAKKRLAQYED